MEISIEGLLDNKNTSTFAECTHFDEIYIRDQGLITVEIAKQLLPIRSVFKLTVWCGITRAAMRHITSRPNLNELIVFELRSFGKMSGFEDASSLTYFSCVCGLNEADILELSRCRSLKKLGAQQANITEFALEALLELPLLTEIDFEDSNFNDDHASIISQSKTITKLDIGQCQFSKVGLKKICSMKQLKSLDIWSNNIEESDLDLLSGLPNLEYLSIGGSEGQTTFTAKNTIPKLEKIPSLKALWLDGLNVTNDEWKYLNTRYHEVKLAAIHM